MIFCIRMAHKVGMGAASCKNWILKIDKLGHLSQEFISAFLCIGTANVDCVPILCVVLKHNVLIGPF